MKKIAIVLSALVFLSLSVKAQTFKLANIPELVENKIITLDKESGKKMWQSEVQYQLVSEDGEKYIRYTEKGRGLYGSSKALIEWEVLGFYYVEPYIRPYYSEKKIYSDTGKLLKVETLQYNAEDKKIYFRGEDKVKNKVEKQTFNFEDDVVDKYILGLALQGYDFQGKQNFTFHYLSDEPKMYSNTLVYRDKETVTVPAGSFDCHKVELTVNLGALGFVGAFLPKIYFWYSDTDQPAWIKYEGLESGLGTPYVLMQLAN